MDPIEKHYLADPLLVETAQIRTIDMAERAYGKGSLDKVSDHALGVYLSLEIARAQRYQISSPEKRAKQVVDFLAQASRKS